jgi:hypothetical protein
MYPTDRTVVFMQACYSEYASSKNMTARSYTARQLTYMISLTHYFVHSYRLLLVLKAQCPNASAVKGIFYLLIRMLRYQDLARSRGALETGSGIHHITYHRIIETAQIGGADVAGYQFPAIDTYRYFRQESYFVIVDG